MIVKELRSRGFSHIPLKWGAKFGTSELPWPQEMELEKAEEEEESEWLKETKPKNAPVGVHLLNLM